MVTVPDSFQRMDSIYAYTMRYAKVGHDFVSNFLYHGPLDQWICRSISTFVIVDIQIDAMRFYKAIKIRFYLAVISHEGWELEANNQIS